MPGVAGNFNPSTNTNPLSSFGNPSSFTAGATQQASDYDTIMNSYRNLLNNSTGNPVTPSTVAPQTVAPTTTPYTQSSDVTGSLANLSNLSQTGGYTAQGKADILARDVSPTRGIYANAQQNVQRAQALGGGYSPNAGAVQASMARDESQQISGIDTAANAGIAQNVAANQLTAGNEYAGASATANAAKTQSDQNNANIVNSINEANASRNVQAQETNQAAGVNAAFGNRANAQGAVQGQTGLYGTTPALTNTFGNQVMQATNAGQGQQQINEQQMRDIYGMASSGG